MKCFTSTKRVSFWLQGISFVILSLVTTHSYAYEITKKEVWDFIYSVENAVKDKNIEVLAVTISDTAIFNMEVEDDDETRVFKFGKLEYLAMLKQVWEAQGKDYQYERTKTRFVIDGTRAQIVSITKEKYPEADQLQTGKSLSISDVTKENGKLKLMSFFGKNFKPDDAFPEPKITLQ